MSLLLTSCPDNKIRDGKLAIKLTKKLMDIHQAKSEKEEKRGGKHPLDPATIAIGRLNIKDVYGMTLAENGEYKKAIENQRDIIEKANSTLENVPRQFKREVDELNSIIKTAKMKQDLYREQKAHRAPKN